MDSPSAAHQDSTMGKMPNQMVSSGTRMKVGVAMEATMYDHTPEQKRICTPPTLPPWAAIPICTPADDAANRNAAHGVPWARILNKTYSGVVVDKLAPQCAPS